MKNLERIDILLNKKYMGSFDFALSLFRGIKTSSCPMNELKIRLDGEMDDEQTGRNMT